MPPKFRGNSDDWLDDEKSGRRKTGVRPKKEIQARSVGLSPDQANAIVAEVFPNQCRIRMKDSALELLCSYRRAQVVSKSKSETRERTPVAVGDRVLVQQTGDGTGVIEGICTRSNCISRPAPGRDNEKLFHVLAANIDLLVIVASCQEPEFSLGLIDRFLVSAESEGVDACICVTKIDLNKSNDKPWEIYPKLGYPVFEVSSKQAFGVAEISQKVNGRTVVFCGQSGVGKTSLLRILLGKDVGKVGNVNEFTGKGRHTTTSAVLLDGPNESNWIDTPGVREFGLSKITPDTLFSCFPEFRDLKCSQDACQHLDESNCDARHLERYSSYRRILASLLEE